MITSFILAALTSPISWQQIELNQNLLSNEPITLNQKVTLPTHSQLKVVELVSLDEIQVLSYKLKMIPCDSTLKNETSEMIILNNDYGFQLEQGCNLNVFVEIKDLSKPSLFSLIAR